MTILGYSFIAFIVRLFFLVVFASLFFVHFAYFIAGIGGYNVSKKIHKSWILCKARVKGLVPDEFKHLVPLLEWKVSDSVYSRGYSLEHPVEIEDEVDFYYNPFNWSEGEPAVDKRTYCTMIIDGLLNVILFTVGMVLLFVL